MKKTILVVIALAMITLSTAACWNPSVKAVAITAPWDKMDLPVKDNAIVWESDAKKLKVALKAGKPEAGEAFLKALEKERLEDVRRTRPSRDLAFLRVRKRRPEAENGGL